MFRMERVSHFYEEGEPSLADVSFIIDKGERIVLLGTNGSGKSSLLKILNGLMAPTSGKVYFDGTELSRGVLKNRSFAIRFRKEVVFLFQNPDAMLFNPTVYDEIAFGLKQFRMEDIDERVRHWAATMGLGDRLDAPPYKLSLGEKQKVCLASLLALEPEVLLLDEPTSNLDPRSTGWLIDFLAGLDKTILVATHNISMALELGRRALLLSEDHRLVFDGGTEDLLDDRERLIRANLLHIHKHEHEKLEHEHFHYHDWE